MTTPRILVVEDEDSLATLLQYNLEKEGYAVAVAGDGEEALLQVQERLPDLIVLDWMLPKVSGIEVCRRIRQRSDSRNVPIIMLTARGEESDRIRGLDTGADDYVVKPFAMSELAARVRAVLRRLRPGVYGILMSLEPAFGAASGLVVLGERLEALVVLGIALVVTASIGVVRGERAREARQTERG